MRGVRFLLPFLFAVSSVAPAAAGATASPEAMDPGLRAYLLARYREDPVPGSDDPGDAPEAAASRIGRSAYYLVYVRGPHICGASGGCRPMVVRKTGAGYEPVSILPVAYLPLRLYPDRAGGLPALGFGDRDGRVRKVRFTGQGWDSRYPSGTVSTTGSTIILSEQSPFVPLR